MPTLLRHLKRAVIKEEYIEITGDLTEAIILNQMIYWSERVKDFDKFIAQEKEQMDNPNKNESEYKLLNGWIHKSAAELKDEIMSADSQRTIARKMQNLVDKGFLQRRNNPKAGYDRKYQYRVNLVAIKAALDKQGLPLDGYAEYFTSVNNAPGDAQDNTDSFICQNGKCSGHDDKCFSQAGKSIRQPDNSICHSVQAIPEITTETTVETSPSYSPMTADSNSAGKKDDEGEDAYSGGLCSRRENQEAVKQVVDLYNKLCPSYPHVEGITQKRRQTIQVLLNQLDGNEDKLRQLFQKAEDCNYLKGNNDLNWQASFDWLTDADNAVKILEGFYHDHKKPKITCLTNRTSDSPSFDIDEYVKLSMQQLHNESP
jgi:hypothetical protein